MNPDCILQKLGAVQTPFICHIRHPRRKGNILPDGTGFGFRAVCNCVHLNHGEDIAMRMWKAILSRRWRNRDSLILCNNQPSGSGIRNHSNGIHEGIACGDTSGKVRNTGIDFRGIVTFPENSGINILHTNLLAGGALAPTLVIGTDFFLDVSQVAFV